jgi:hypothetical protein
MWPFTSSKKPDAASRQDRAKCWEARDAYFACLDVQHIIVPGKEEGKCSAENHVYEQNCARSWVNCLYTYTLAICSDATSRSSILTNDEFSRNSRNLCLNKQRYKQNKSGKDGNDGTRKDLYMEFNIYSFISNRFMIFNFTLK